MSFSVNMTSNIDEILGKVEGEMPVAQVVSGEIINPTEYADWLNRRMGYWVMNDPVLAENFDAATREALERAGREGRLFGDEDRARAATEAIRETVKFYQSVVGVKDTRGKVSLPPRDLHPGNWADDSRTLVKSYVSYTKADGRIIDFSTYEDYQPS